MHALHDRQEEEKEKEKAGHVCVCGSAKNTSDSCPPACPMAKPDSCSLSLPSRHFCMPMWHSHATALRQFLFLCAPPAMLFSSPPPPLSPISAPMGVGRTGVGVSFWFQDFCRGRLVFLDGRVYQTSTLSILTSIFIQCAHFHSSLFIPYSFSVLPGVYSWWFGRCFL